MNWANKVSPQDSDLVHALRRESTIESKTKGIWMWCVPHPYKEGHTLVLLDTEGLGDVKKNLFLSCAAPDTTPKLLFVEMKFYSRLGDHGHNNQGDEKHDTWIFCLAVLLSSTLVYNSLGVIDNNALEKLHYVTELTENIRVKAEVSRDEDESADCHCLSGLFATSL